MFFLLYLSFIVSDLNSSELGSCISEQLNDGVFIFFKDDTLKIFDFVTGIRNFGFILQNNGSLKIFGKLLLGGKEFVESRSVEHGCFGFIIV